MQSKSQSIYNTKETVTQHKDVLVSRERPTDRTHIGHIEFRYITESKITRISPFIKKNLTGFVKSPAVSPKRLTEYHQKMIIMGVFDVVKLICNKIATLCVSLLFFKRSPSMVPMLFGGESPHVPSFQCPQRRFEQTIT